MRGRKGEPRSDGQACPTCGKCSPEHEERRMKGSSYETGLGKARSGRKTGAKTWGGAEPAGQV